MSRVERSDFRLPVFVTYTSMKGVLRRPVESALAATVGVMDAALGRLPQCNGHIQGPDRPLSADLLYKSPGGQRITLHAARHGPANHAP